MRSFNIEPREIVFALSEVYCWTMLTVAIWAWLAAVDRWRPTLPERIGAHLFGIFVTALVDTAWRRTALRLLHYHMPLPFQGTLLYYLDLTTAAYVAILITRRVVDARAALVAHERRELILRAQVAQAQLEYLEAQLQPHFLFNSLGAVIELAHEAPSAAARMLRKLAVLLQFAVHGRGQTVTLREELQALEPYLDIQRLRFADWLTIEQQVSPDALETRVPRLTLQPLVENALRHGLTSRTERGRITITAASESGMMQLAVADNGVGLTTSVRRPHSGIGLRNLEHRLSTLYGERAAVALRAAPGGGAVTEVRVPTDNRLALSEEREAATEMPHTIADRLPELLRRRPILTIALAWLIWGVISIQLSVAWLVFRNRFQGVDMLLSVFADNMTAIVIWALITPAILALGRRVPMIGPKQVWRLALHGACAAAFALVHFAIWQSLTMPKMQLWAPPYLSTMLWTVMLYAVLVALSSYRELADWLRERETATARLSAELAEAQLTAAALRFDPDVVLNRLERAANLVLVDTALAERALTQLAEHLRESLDSARVAPRTLTAALSPQPL